MTSVPSGSPISSAGPTAVITPSATTTVWFSTTPSWVMGITLTPTKAWSASAICLTALSAPPPQACVTQAAMSNTAPILTRIVPLLYVRSGR